jgi:hypothetical protein
MSRMILIEELKFKEGELTASLFQNQVLTLILIGEFIDVKQRCSFFSLNIQHYHKKPICFQIGN